MSAQQVHVGRGGAVVLPDGLRQRFKLEDSADTDKPQSWVLSLLQRSRLWHWVFHRARKEHHVQPMAVAPKRPREGAAGLGPMVAGIKWVALALLAAGALRLDRTTSY